MRLLLKRVRHPGRNPQPKLAAFLYTETTTCQVPLDGVVEDNMACLQASRCLQTISKVP